MRGCGRFLLANVSDEHAELGLLREVGADDRLE